MTDEQISRLVAEKVCGWQKCECDQHCGFWYEGDTAHTLPAYCTDPAAWGALLVWLAEEGKRVNIWRNITLRLWIAGVDGEMTHDPAPGRALALAALKAYGVEVEG